MLECHRFNEGIPVIFIRVFAASMHITRGDMQVRQLVVSVYGWDNEKGNEMIHFALAHAPTIGALLFDLGQSLFCSSLPRMIQDADPVTNKLDFRVYNDLVDLRHELQFILGQPGRSLIGPPSQMTSKDFAIVVDWLAAFELHNSIPF